MAQSTIMNKRFKSGFCQLRSKGCMGQTATLEWHHESYYPNARIARKDGRGLETCHKCHFKVHFNWRQLSLEDRKKLIMMRTHPNERINLMRSPADWDLLAENYRPPSKEASKKPPRGV